MRTLELKIPPMLVAAIAAGVIWLVARAAPALRLEIPLRGVLAVVIALAGFGVAIAGVVSFRRARTTVNPLNPAAASALVVSGLYRVTRSPMYLGVLLCLLGLVVWFGSVPALVVLPLFVAYMNRFQIIQEEAALRALFGAEFDSYRARVRRWI
ncbi:MAG TPA: isoprenylcysteine carboxylmethyltransferase family protein [Opitutaceae bacterium]|nr:isoprenylcysteine carboxylmethyltransferase family protein [Opitutaceae bacterium]